MVGKCGGSSIFYQNMLPYDQQLEVPEDIHVELATVGPYELVGEIGAPDGTWRRTSIVTSSYTEVLELTRHDLLTRLKDSCRVS